MGQAKRADGTKEKVGGSESPAEGRLASWRLRVWGRNHGTREITDAVPAGDCQEHEV